MDCLVCGVCVLSIPQATGDAELRTRGRRRATLPDDAASALADAAVALSQLAQGAQVSFAARPTTQIQGRSPRTGQAACHASAEGCACLVLGTQGVAERLSAEASGLARTLQALNAAAEAELSGQRDVVFAAELLLCEALAASAIEAEAGVGAGPAARGLVAELPANRPRGGLDALLAQRFTPGVCVARAETLAAAAEDGAQAAARAVQVRWAGLGLRGGLQAALCGRTKRAARGRRGSRGGWESRACGRLSVKGCVGCGAGRSGAAGGALRAAGGGGGRGRGGALTAVGAVAAAAGHDRLPGAPRPALRGGLHACPTFGSCAPCTKVASGAVREQQSLDTAAYPGCALQGEAAQALADRAHAKAQAQQAAGDAAAATRYERSSAGWRKLSARLQRTAAVVGGCGEQLAAAAQTVGGLPARVRPLLTALDGYLDAVLEAWAAAALQRLQGGQ
jgi:hypothetical protein